MVNVTIVIFSIHHKDVRRTKPKNGIVLGYRFKPRVTYLSEAYEHKEEKGKVNRNTSSDAMRKAVSIHNYKPFGMQFESDRELQDTGPV